ncbi:MAG: four helix bundle protein [Isosphaeraceae bacterium]
MPYQRFEELPVWKDAIELAARILRISQTGRFKGVGDLKSQLERAAISVSNNIAEGYERGTSEELITFLYIARGSVGEVRSMLHLLNRLPGLDEIATDVMELRRLTDAISRQLGGWVEAIKNSEHKGHRSQNDRTRATAQAVRRRDQFLEKVRAVQDEAVRGLRSSRGEDATPQQPETQDPVE